jgi:UDP-N-acetylglucosamine transferase subunit ALG13
MTTEAGPEPTWPRVVVTVGMDHHPFNRLISWTNDWLRSHPEQVGRFFVQSGSASVIPVCPSSQFLDVKRMSKVLDETDVIVCHGGPVTIAEAWERGLRPIVAPRLPQLGEHVDDHQMHFCLKLAELDCIWLTQTPAEFASNLSEATSDHSRLRARLPPPDIDAVVARFGRLVDEVVGKSRRRAPLWHRSRRASPSCSDRFSPPAMKLPPELIQEQNGWSRWRGQPGAGVHELGDKEQV